MAKEFNFCCVGFLFLWTPSLCVFFHLDGDSTTKGIRLLTSNRTRSGQVEIYHDGSWEAICFDKWDIHDAFVACRQLGFGGAEAITKETRPNHRSLKSVHCKGNEDTLGDCITDWKRANCDQDYAGVRCSGKLIEWQPKNREMFKISSNSKLLFRLWYVNSVGTLREET